MNENSFSRTLTLKNSIYLGLSSMIGAGLFNNIAPTAKVSSYSAILGLLLASTLAFANASSSAQLASLYPQTGGTYLYAKNVLGNGAANIAGFVFIIGKTISCIAIALTLGNYLSPVNSKEFAVLLSFVVFLIGFTGIHKTARIAKWFVWILFGLLAFYTVSILITPGVRFNIPITDQFSINSLLLSGSIWFFAFTGYSRLATFGEEVNNPEKIIPKAILTGLGITLFLYVSTSYATLGIVSPSIIENSSTPLKVAFDLSRFSEFSYLIVIASTIATGSVLLALLPGISRVLVAMSRDKKIPDYFKTIHPKQNSAYISDIFGGLLVAAGVLTFDLLPAVKLSAIFILIYYSITNLCVIRLEKSERIFSVMISIYGLVFCGTLGIFLVIYF